MNAVFHSAPVSADEMEHSDERTKGEMVYCGA